MSNSNESQESLNDEQGDELNNARNDAQSDGQGTQSARGGSNLQEGCDSSLQGDREAEAYDAPLFTMRATEEKDLPYLNLMASGQEVGIPPNYLEGGTCAVNYEDIPVGYIHVESTDLGPHVAPVVVFENWRMHGVGAALIKNAYEEYGPLKLVSNGSSNGFYERLGFVPCEWDAIEPQFQRDCLSCPYYEMCGPKPYILNDLSAWEGNVAQGGETQEAEARQDNIQESGAQGNNTGEVLGV